MQETLAVIGFGVIRVRFNRVLEILAGLVEIAPQYQRGAPAHTRLAVSRLGLDRRVVAADRLPCHQFRGLIRRQGAGWLPAVVPLPKENCIS